MTPEFVSSLHDDELIQHPSGLSAHAGRAAVLEVLDSWKDAANEGNAPIGLLIQDLDEVITQLQDFRSRTLSAYDKDRKQGNA
jgi:hypothetical protein